MTLERLNPQQIEAVETVDGPLLVLAGAGTGKTRVITVRIARLIQHGIAPEHILAVTFTNKAAREMRERVAALLHNDLAARVTIGTFHAVCARILRRRVDRLGISTRFGIAARGYQVGLVQALAAELGLRDTGKRPRDWIRAISGAKNTLLRPEDLREADATPEDLRLAELYELYEKRLHGMDLLDFDDLLVMVLRIWQEFPNILELYREQYRYILVDEYQDTNAVQFQLLAALAGDRANLCAVGDDDQSIYGWRGADVGNILRFQDCFPGTRIIRLEQNYRSTTTILDAANGAISPNPHRHSKTLWSARGEGEDLLIVSAEDEEREAAFVAESILDRAGTANRPWRDFAVLFRSNHQSRLLEQAFRQQHVPYRVVGGQSFYQRREILDALSYISVAVNPLDDLSLLRVLNVPPRGLGDKAVERLKYWRHVLGIPLRRVLGLPEYRAELAAAASSAAGALLGALDAARDAFEEQDALARTVEVLLEESGYLNGLIRIYKSRADALSRRENVYEFINSVAEFEKTRGPSAGIRRFLEQFALMDDNDRVDGDKAGDAVTLSTVHAAKGLEFPFVYIAGMEQGLFPHRQALEEHRLDEERRLFYVALTRARDTLVITHAKRRRVRRDHVRRRPSVFLDSLPDRLVQYCTPKEAIQPAPPEVADEYIARMRALFTPQSKP